MLLLLLCFVALLAAAAAAGGTATTAAVAVAAAAAATPAPTPTHTPGAGADTITSTLTPTSTASTATAATALSPLSLTTSPLVALRMTFRNRPTRTDGARRTKLDRAHTGHVLVDFDFEQTHGGRLVVLGMCVAAAQRHSYHDVGRY